MLVSGLGCHFIRSSQIVGDGLGTGVMIVTTGDNVGELEGDSVGTGVMIVTTGDDVGVLDGDSVGLIVGAHSSL